MLDVKTFPAVLHEVETGLESEVRCTLEALQHRVGAPDESARECRTVEAIVALTRQPKIAAALRGRRDRREAVRDLATRYAFHRLMYEGASMGELDTLSRALIRRALDVIHKRARQVEHRRGDNPLDVDSGLLLSLCKSLGRYVPHKPMGSHIQWKLEHCESAVSRAMRQIKHLLTRPEVTELFVGFLLDELSASVAGPELKAQLLQVARGGGLRGIDYEAIIRFFAHPEVVAFVKRFAETVQTARTLYAEEEYAAIAWRGRRRLPRGRRQGYLDVALAEMERPHNFRLDGYDDAGEGTDGRHELLGQAPVPPAAERSRRLRGESFEAWVTRCALEARPEDPLWQVAQWLYVEGLPNEEVVARGLAERKTVDAVREYLAALRADEEVWHLWMATTLR